MKVAVDICNTIANINESLGKFFVKNPGEYRFNGATEEFFSNHLEIFSEAEPIFGAAYALRKVARKHEIVYITSRPQAAVGVTLEWLQRWNFPPGKIYFATKNTSKTDIAVKEGISLAFEDDPEQIREYIDVNIPTFAPLWDYTKNYNTFSWPDIDSIIAV